MGCTDRYVMNQRGQDDHRLRCELLAAAYGCDPVAARAALASLRRIYRLRLPLVEARLSACGDAQAGLGLNDSDQPSAISNQQKDAA